MFIILIIILTNIDLTISEQNISHGKPVSICGTDAEALTDGDRLGVNTFQTKEGCNKLTFKINIEAGHLLKYMIIFTGERGSVSTPDHGLNHLQTTCEYEGRLTVCAVISTRMNMIKQMENGIRINFMQDMATVLHLKFPNKVTEIMLSEIEVYSRESVIYRGCLKTIRGSRRPFEGFHKCKEDCSGQNAFGINQRLSACICLDELNMDTEVSLSKCDTTCHDSHHKCGGHFSSVYITKLYLPTFLGCYSFTPFLREARANGEVDLEIPIRNVTFAKCMRYCGERNTFFWKGKCGCAGNVTFSHLPSFCDIPCEFNEENACGGESGVSLYRSCFINNIIPCDKMLKCQRAMFDHNGVCLRGCKSGFGGEHCILKVSDREIGEIDKPDEEIKLEDITTTSTISMVTSSDTEEPITNVTPPDTEEPITNETSPDTQESIDMVTSPDTQESIDMVTLSYTQDSTSDSNITATKSTSVRLMVDYIFSVWVAACYMSIHCATYY